MNRMKFVSAIALIGMVYLYSGCEKKTTASTTSSPPSLTGINAALSVPAMGGGSSRPASRSACNANNHFKRLRIPLIFARNLLCSFGALEDGGVISIPSTNGSSNYYSYTYSGHTYLMRNKLNTGGHRIVSFYIDGVKRTEAYIYTPSDGTTVYISDYLSPSELGTGYAYFTASMATTKDSDGYHFKSAYLGASAADTSKFFGVYMYLTAGSPNTFWSFVDYGTSAGIDTLFTYSRFDSTQGATYTRITSSGSTGSPIKEAWNNDSTSSCVTTQSSGTYYSEINSYTYSAPTAITGAYADAWDGTTPSGSTLSVISSLDIGVLAKVATCFTTYPTTEPTQTTCPSSGACR